MKEFWESLVDPSYDFEREWIRSDDASIEECLEALGEIKGPALEIGSGTGLLTRAVKEAGVNVQGIDLAQTLVDYASVQSDDIEYTVCTGDGNIPVDGPFKTIYSTFVFQHCNMATVRNYIDSAYEKLEKGGVLTFQYVTRCEESPLSFQHDPQIVEWHCNSAGFIVTQNQQKLISEWNWIRCVKGQS